MLLFCVGQFVVDCLETLVGDCEVVDLAFESETGRTVLNTFLHLCNHHSQFFHLLFKNVYCMIILCTLIIFSTLMFFPLIFLQNKCVQRLLQFLILYFEVIIVNFDNLQVILQLISVGKHSLNLFLSQKELFLLLLADFFGLLQAQVVVLELDCQEIHFSIFFFQEFTGLKLIMLHFSPKNIFKADSLA